MKKKLLYALLAVIGMYSCSSDDEGKKELIDPCENVTCLNEGVCADGKCTCPDGYTGTECEVQNAPKKMFITRVKVTKFPAMHHSDPWDSEAGEEAADIIIDIPDADFTTTVFENADSTQELVYTPATPVELDPDFYYNVTMYDNDDLLNSYRDYMGVVYFTPYRKKNGFSETITVDGYYDSIEIELTVTYEW